MLQMPSMVPQWRAHDATRQEGATIVDCQTSQDAQCPHRGAVGDAPPRTEISAGPGKSRGESWAALGVPEGPKEVVKRPKQLLNSVKNMFVVRFRPGTSSTVGSTKVIFKSD